MNNIQFVFILPDLVVDPACHLFIMVITINVIDAITIGVVVATFLVNTGRAKKGIELCQECLILLSNVNKGAQSNVYESLQEGIYTTVFKAFGRIYDYANAIRYGTELLAVLRESGDRMKEGMLTLKLGQLYRSDCRYEEAKDVLDEAVRIMKEIGFSQGEANAYTELGFMFQSTGEYRKGKEYYKKALDIDKQTGNRKGEAISYVHIGNVFTHLGETSKAEEYWMKAFGIGREIGDKAVEACCYGSLGCLFKSFGQYRKAKAYHEKALSIHSELGNKEGEATHLVNLGNVFCSLGDLANAQEYYAKALTIAKEIRWRRGEVFCCGSLGTLCSSRGEYSTAKSYLFKAIEMNKEVGDRYLEAKCYGNLGNVYCDLAQYDKAKVYTEKALAINLATGDREGQATHYNFLGDLFRRLGDFSKAKRYHQDALDIWEEIGDRRGQAEGYSCLGSVFRCLGEYVKAKEYLEKALAIGVEICDRKEEMKGYSELGMVFISLSEYRKAREYHEKALMITIEIGDRYGEANCYGNLGSVFKLLTDYPKAVEYYEKSLAMAVQLGDRKGEAISHGNLGLVLICCGDYEKARAHLEKALAVQAQIGDRASEATSYGNLGLLFVSLGENVKGIAYFKKALAIRKEISDSQGEGVDYENLGTAFGKLGEYDKAHEYLKKSLETRIRIGDRHGQASTYGNLGSMFVSLGEYHRAEEYLRKALAIRIEIGDRAGEASNYLNLGRMFLSLHDHSKGEEFTNRGYVLAREIGDGEKEVQSLSVFTLLKVAEESYDEAFKYLFNLVKKIEDMRGLLGENDQFKISYSHMTMHSFPFHLFSKVLCAANRPLDALCVIELGRARALADLMESHYRVKQQISSDPQSWNVVGKIMMSERNCVCLYISYSSNDIFYCILKSSGVMHYRWRRTSDYTLVKNLDVFLDKSFRGLTLLPEEHCEDRSLFSLNRNEMGSKLFPEEGMSTLRIVEEEDEDERSQEPDPTLSLYYNLIIAPVADQLDEPEIIIVPDRAFYKVPFAALSDNNGKYLSECFRIRIVPSLTTLKLIQDCPGSYHCQTGALVVGDPEVGLVHYKGKVETISQLPFARKEAEMIGRLLSTQPLLGKQATKQEVLQRIHSVSLVHFAAHGDAERGEIALASPCLTSEIAQEEDYLLTLADISKVRLRAKLVVLSCCHSASGQIKAEGVVGIARAFLGSGACAVVVSLWALDDRATEQFMNRFYGHLVSGESASESLHQSMKWMRNNGYPEVRDWAPFMLIGGDVTFEFEKWPK